MYKTGSVVVSCYLLLAGSTILKGVGSRIYLICFMLMGQWWQSDCFVSWWLCFINQPSHPNSKNKTNLFFVKQCYTAFLLDRTFEPTSNSSEHLSQHLIHQNIYCSLSNPKIFTSWFLNDLTKTYCICYYETYHMYRLVIRTIKYWDKISYGDISKQKLT